MHKDINFKRAAEVGIVTSEYGVAYGDEVLRFTNDDGQEFVAGNFLNDSAPHIHTLACIEEENTATISVREYIATTIWVGQYHRKAITHTLGYFA